MWGMLFTAAVGPLLTSAITAIAVWTVKRRTLPLHQQGERWQTLLAAALGVLVIGGLAVSGVLSLWSDLAAGASAVMHPYRFALPLALGLLMLVVLSLFRRGHDARVGALLVPRTWRSFVADGWLLGYAAAVAVIVAITLSTGFASQPDDEGRYTQYVIDVGSGTLGTGIYGWHYSVIPLILLVFLTVRTWWALSALARPPLGTDLALDRARRRLASANVLRVALGALLLHLQAVLASLASTASLTGTFHAPDDFFFTSRTSFSALGGTLEIAAILAGAIGLGLWIFTGLTALPRSPHRTDFPVSS